MSTSPPTPHLNPEAVMERLQAGQAVGSPDDQSKPSPRAIVDHLLQDAADRARWCGNSQDFLAYATAVSMLAAARQALPPGPSFSVAPRTSPGATQQ